MAAVVDICNLALGHLGDEATISSIDPPDGSAQAGHCAQFYPIVRDSLLEMHTWRFNTKRAVLALSAQSAPVGWAYVYTLPSDCVKPIAVLMPASRSDLFSTQPTLMTPSNTDTNNAQDYVVEADPDDGTPILYTNVAEATLLYSIGVTDPTKFPPLVVTAIARLLASYLAGPIIKGATGMAVAKAHLEAFEKVDLPRAEKADANARQSSPYSNATPAPIAARL